MPRKKTEPDQEFIGRMNEIVGKGGGQNEFARKANMAQGTLRPYLFGAEPTRPQLISLAKAANRSISWLATGKEENEGKVVATIEPGQPEKKALLREAGKRITETDPSLRVLVEWMEEYFGEDPDQIPSFFLDMVKNWPSFDEFLEKKGFGRDRQNRPLEKKSVNDG